jgi:hypothetical protein
MILRGKKINGPEPLLICWVNEVWPTQCLAQARNNTQTRTIRNVCHFIKRTPAGSLLACEPLLPERVGGLSGSMRTSC